MLDFVLFSGKEHEILGESPARKLTCTFALVKQLFEGACKAIGVPQPKPPAPMKRITDIMAPSQLYPIGSVWGSNRLVALG